MRRRRENELLVEALLRSFISLLEPAWNFHFVATIDPSCDDMMTSHEFAKVYVENDVELDPC